jgi:hypothetical protein
VIMAVNPSAMLMFIEEKQTSRTHHQTHYDEKIVSDLLYIVVLTKTEVIKSTRVYPKVSGLSR